MLAVWTSGSRPGVGAGEAVGRKHTAQC
jgi:hypothetical protein